MPGKTPKRLIISPHCDDAALSLGGLILKKGDFEILDVFSICAWSVLPQLTEAGEITRINNNEERLVGSKMSYKLQLMGLPEALLRGYPSWNSQLDREKDRKIMKIVVEIIVNKVERYTEVYFPLGVGRHVDHLLVFEAMLRVKRRNLRGGINYYLFEDMPYAIYYNVETRVKEIQKYCDVNPSLVDISSEIRQKVSLLSTYKSQLTQQDIKSVKDYSRKLVPNNSYHERIWFIRKTN